MVLKIPHSYASQFPSFFQDFDQDLETLGVRSYGISISTLEEVFLKVGHLKDPSKKKKSTKDELPEWRKPEKKRKKAFNLRDNHAEVDTSFQNNFMAVLIMRLNSYKRNKKAFLNEVIIPALIMLVALALTKIPRNYESVSRVLDPDWLPQPQSVLVNPLPVVLKDENANQMDFITNLPGSWDWQLSSWNQSSAVTPTTTFQNFGDQVFQTGQERNPTPPYQYGSFQIYEADIEQH
jgi:hypothetical protein